MAEEAKNQNISERKKESVMQQLWLSYYNDTLFAKGVITEKEHNKMRVMIKNRAVSLGG